MKFLKPLLLILAAAAVSVAITSEPVRATFYKWSTTAATDANVDSTINWAEGMAPSAVNDSARAMMAALAKFRLDTSGSLVLAGTSTAYTLTTNQVFSSLALMDGNGISFRPNVTSGAAPTLNVDGLGAKSLNQATTVAVATGALIAGAVYRAVYVNASNEWIVQGLANVAAVIPSGSIMLALQAACPTGWTISTATNDRALIISSSAGATAAGTTAFSTYFNGSSTVGGTSITQAQLPLYDLFLGSLTGSVGTTINTQFNGINTVGGGTGAVINGGASSTTGTATLASGAVTFGGTISTSGSGSTHTHTIPSLQSVTAIACTKN